MIFFQRNFWHRSNTAHLVFGFLVAGCIVLAGCIPTLPDPPSTPDAIPSLGPIKVQVYDAVSKAQLKDGVIVRVAGKDKAERDENGMFRLNSCDENQYITAWKAGYYIYERKCEAGKTEYDDFKLTPINVSNATILSWISAGSFGDPYPHCVACHSDKEGLNENWEWQKDGHSTVFRDPYFWTMYLGSDVLGNRSENTQRTLDDQGHQIPLPPNRSKQYFGPGFKIDYPSESGNCAYCHAPAAAIGSQIRMDLTQTINEAHGNQHNVFTEGVTCDVCHKVMNVQLDGNNMPFPDKPGVLSFEFIHEDPLLVMGPLTSAMDLHDPKLNFSCSPVFSESQFCAPCHTAKFYGTQIYDSYGEWKASKYSDQGSDNYKTCQACHMLPAGVTDLSKLPKTNDRESCYQGKSTYSDFSHDMMLREDINSGNENLKPLIKQAATVTAKQVVNAKDGVINLTVTVTNTNAGHKFPTDSPMRHLILLVKGTTTTGVDLPLIKGTTIPSWGGEGNTIYDYAGKPGTIYANILMDSNTFISPTVAYWNPVQPAWIKSDKQPTSSDTRIPAGEADVSKYVFAMPPNGQANFHVTLIYRYAFIELARQKGWQLNDIVVDEIDVKAK